MKDSEKKLHVAIIMDGNGRWAEADGRPRRFGHRFGAAAVDRTTEAAVEAGIHTLTLYAFSTENWRRPPMEVKFLMSLLRVFLKSKRRKLLDNGVRLRWLGQRHRVPVATARLFEEIEAETAHLTRMTLVLAVDYGGRWELTQAAAKLAAVHAEKSSKSSRGSGKVPEIGEDDFAACLPAPWLPDVDLLIRTAGERRLSNFLLWQAAYAELYFTPVLWPEFGGEELRRALAWYRQRIRRWGGLPNSARNPPPPATRPKGFLS